MCTSYGYFDEAAIPKGKGNVLVKNSEVRFPISHALMHRWVKVKIGDINNGKRGIVYVAVLNRNYHIF